MYDVLNYMFDIMSFFFAGETELCHMACVLKSDIAV